MPTEDGARASLLDLARAEVRKPGPYCGVRIAREANPELADQVVELIDNTPAPIPYKVASATLAKVNITLRPDAISRHRRGECGCA